MIDIKTCLVKKVAESPKICTNCDYQIPSREVFYLEKGINKHLHSLIARSFCSNCYKKFGEKKLLTGSK
jgi:hypothetical protein